MAGDSWPAKSTSTSIVQPTCASVRESAVVLAAAAAFAPAPVLLVVARPRGHWWMWSSREKLSSASLEAVPLSDSAAPLPMRRDADSTQPRAADARKSSTVAATNARQSAVEDTASARGWCLSRRRPWCVTRTKNGTRMCISAVARPRPAIAAVNAAAGTTGRATARIQADAPSASAQKKALIVVAREGGGSSGGGDQAGGKGASLLLLVHKQLGTVKQTAGESPAAGEHAHL